MAKKTATVSSKDGSIITVEYMVDEKGIGRYYVQESQIDGIELSALCLMIEDLKTIYRESKKDKEITLCTN